MCEVDKEEEGVDREAGFLLRGVIETIYRRTCLNTKSSTLKMEQALSDDPAPLFAAPDYAALRRMKNVALVHNYLGDTHYAYVTRNLRVPEVVVHESNILHMTECSVIWRGKERSRVVRKSLLHSIGSVAMQLLPPKGLIFMPFAGGH